MAEFHRSERRESIRVKRASELGYSVAIVKMMLTLNSADAQLLFEHFHFTAIALFKLENTIRKWASEEDITNLQKCVYEELLAPLSKEVKKLQADYLNIDLTKEQENDVSFTQLRTEEVEITCPEARDLLNILIDFDKLVVRLYQLRFARKITSDVIFKVRRETRQRLKGDEIKIERLVANAIRIARERAKTEEEQAEVEAGLASMETAAAEKKSARTGRGNGRGNGTKSKKVTDTSPEPGKDENSKAPEQTMKELAEKSFSPFGEEPEASEAAAASVATS